MLPIEANPEKFGGRSGKSQGRQDRTAEFARLPDRTFWFYWKKRGLEAVKLVSPTVNFEKAKRAADRAPTDIRDACLGRVGGQTRGRLDRVIEQRRAHMLAVANGMAHSGQPDWRRAVAELGDVTPVGSVAAGGTEVSSREVKNHGPNVLENSFDVESETLERDANFAFLG